MKVKTSIKKRSSDCKIVKRKGKLYVINKKNPKFNIPKGSVGIGGSQTGIYPNESPGGWHIIGNSPINLFDSEQSPPCFIKPGDKVALSCFNLPYFPIIYNGILKASM